MGPDSRRDPLASIVVNNYNYGRFLAEAIDSALGQEYPHVEVIVVDDGSTDGSPAVIATYGDRIRPVLKANGGQASAFNAGFAASRGELVFFLDADDVLLPTAVGAAMARFREEEPVKVHWPLWEVTAEGTRTGQQQPDHPLAEGDLRDAVARRGPDACDSPPTTGNAWSRRFLDRVLPMPEAAFRICADAYLVTLAPLYGPIAALKEPQGLYRLHEQNSYAIRSFSQKLETNIRVYDQLQGLLQTHLANTGVAMDPAAWEQGWPYRLRAAIRTIVAHIPEGERFILVDGNAWGTDDWLEGRQRIPFLERAGEYWGNPADDRTAIRELERLRRAGVGFLVVAWPAFWWLDYYVGFHHHLRRTARCLVENERLVIFDLRRGPVPVALPAEGAEAACRNI